MEFRLLLDRDAYLFCLSFQDHGKCNRMTSSNYFGWNGWKKTNYGQSSSHADMKRSSLSSYFQAAEQAQCKFRQDLRWIGLCLCVCVRPRWCLRRRASLQGPMHVCVLRILLSVVKIYVHIRAELQCCSTSSLCLLNQYFKLVWN